jgi:tRNA 2-selenouridine synthase SelU
LISGTPGSFEIKGATTLDVATAKAMSDRGVPFVDVRGPARWAESHIPGAVNLPAISEAELSKIVSKDQESSFKAMIQAGASRLMQLQRPFLGDIRKFFIFGMGFQAGTPQGILLLSHDMPSIVLN